MRATRPRSGLLGLLLAAVLLLVTGCTGSDAPGTTPTPQVPLPAAVPATFTDHAEWTTKAFLGSTPQVDQAGIALLTPGTAPNTIRVSVLDPGTGTALWTSANVPYVVTPDAAPTLSWTSRFGHPLVVLKTVEKTTTTLRSYDLYGTGSARAALATTEFVGEEKAPSVAVSHTGVLVRGSKDSAYLAWRATTGETTAYGKGPKRGDAKAVPIGVYDDAFLVAYPGGGFAFASATGGWDSAKTGLAPKGTDSAKGTVVAQADGLILVAWPSKGRPGIVMAVHSQQGGRLVASQPLDGTALPEKYPGLVVDPSGSWAVWGGYVFGLRGQASHRVDVAGGSPTLVFGDVIYVRGATARIVVQAPTPTPSGTASPGASTPASTPPSAPASSKPTTNTPPSGTPSSGTPSGTASATPSQPPFNGYLAVDVVTGIPVGGDFTASPTGISALTQGVFSTTANGATIVFSVALR